MTNSLANSQAAPAIPAMVMRGRHRRTKPRKNVLSHESEESHLAEPAAFPPHPPLLSGGWYRGMSFIEVLGPGRYPLAENADRSVGAALALSLLGGPVGLCYTSVVGGLTCLALMAIGLILVGFVTLPVVWLIAILWAGVSASRRHRGHTRH